MNLDVAFLPSLLAEPADSVAVVIDVLRATSTIATLLAGGIREVTVAGSLRNAFLLRDATPAAAPLLCGEVGGLPPAGFDQGNSPAELAELNLAGRSAILFTSNGTKALLQVATAAAVFTGALVNRGAVVRAAVQFALAQHRQLVFVCSGTHLGTAICLEDAGCAGAFVETALATADTEVVLGDGAEAAVRLWRSFAGDARALFSAAQHGSLLQTLGLAADLEFCAQIDRFAVVPRVVSSDPRLIVRAQ